MAVAPSKSQRRYDLDWLRIIAFGLLILYHIGMFFVTWDWHVKSQYAGPAIQPLMLLSSPWRLTLLFLIAGIATRYMADRTSSGRLAALRSWRLLLPLVFGMAVIVPPQTYYEIVEKLSYGEGWLAFYARYATGFDGWRPDGNLLIVPTWNHLWFVAYLWVYTMVIILLQPWLRKAPAWFVAPFTGWGVILWPAALLILLRITLRPVFGQTHALLDDWYLHAVYFSVFLFGYGIAKAEPVWAAIDRLRHVALLLAVVCYAALVVLMLNWQGLPQSGIPWRMLRDAVWALDQWVWIVMLLGFARRWLNRDGPARRYLTDAVFPFYILHQTIIVVAGHHLRPLELTAGGEALLLIAVTTIGCVAGYEIVKRIGWLRPLFGLRTEVPMVRLRRASAQ
ncbi:acyltransferase family protein [uncultured Ferrovibrio sp.]|jgi:Predicted acyltransferases|uniref:acyltransferase family protein n=1 Tax=uncultured Ferrovibrio sp. TaxID=1576913 RepID=UPI002633EED8|nr:acyltransferase family protein [uncultured Ferrovibrio sp.]